MGKTKTAFVSELGDTPKKKEKKTEKKEKIHISGLKGGQRIKAIDQGPIVVEEEARVEEKKKKAKKQRSKKWNEAKAKVSKEKLYSLKEAVKLTQETSYSKFNGTMELHLVTKKSGVNIGLELPYSAGKEKKVEIANEDTIKKLSEGTIDFDILIATPDMMQKLVPFARILGPKGLMPNPKNGTLINDIKKAKSFSGKSITIKSEKNAPLIHTTFGKVNQDTQELVSNLEAMIKAVGEKQIVKGYIKATMSPSVKIEIR